MHIADVLHDLIGHSPAYTSDANREDAHQAVDNEYPEHARPEPEPPAKAPAPAETVAHELGGGIEAVAIEVGKILLPEIRALIGSG